jgi:tRNA(His) guanylyltransferase
VQDNLGDRMKCYEAIETERRFIALLPVYARVDGRSFTSFTRGMERPFDRRMAEAMIGTTEYLVESTGAKIGYTQSDEINLVWIADNYDSEVFFAGKIHKIVSVLASMAAARFNQVVAEFFGPPYSDRLPSFDCRVFQLPNRAEAANAFLWRELDATKNAISMAARHYYTTAELHAKSSSAMQEMLFAKGVNFNDYPAFFKRGTFVRRVTQERPLTAAEAERIPASHRPPANAKIKRAETRRLEVPRFSTVTNREEFIFAGAEPVPRSAT